MPSKPPEKDNPDVGFAVPWIAKAFGTTAYKVRSALAGVQPIGKGGKAALYSLPDAAKVLVAKEMDWREALKKMKPADLPANLRREFWTAKKAEQDYRRDNGELWETDAVLEMMSDCFDVFGNGVRLLPDLLEREAGLSPAQRELVERTVDGMMEQWHEKLTEHKKLNNTMDGGEAAE